MTRSGPLAFLKRHKEPSGKTLIRVPSETRYIKKVSSEILSGLALYGLDESRLSDIRLSPRAKAQLTAVRLRLSDMSSKIKSLFEITKLEKLFEIIADEKEAVSTFV